jgi:hypothetical protein
MKKNHKNVYQFKITLKYIKPPIWRRILVPETYTFWDLHVAIQDAMGWTDSHLHKFAVTDASRRRKAGTSRAGPKRLIWIRPITALRWCGRKSGLICDTVCASLSLLRM